jgi:multicomponent Na+:H+ antiporter subunit E
VGAGLAIVVAVALAPMGEVVGPWALLAPRRFVGLLRIVAFSAARIAVANTQLALRIWRPNRPLAPGMVIAPTRERSAGGLAAVGLVSSLIVDNQFVDVDRERHELLYHAVEVPSGGRSGAYEQINGPLEALLVAMQHPANSAQPSAKEIA